MKVGTYKIKLFTGIKSVKIFEDFESEVKIILSS